MEKEPNMEQDEPTKEENIEQTTTEKPIKKRRGVHWVLCVIIAVCSFLGGVLAICFFSSKR